MPRLEGCRTSGPGRAVAAAVRVLGILDGRIPSNYCEVLDHMDANYVFHPSSFSGPSGEMLLTHT